VLVLSILLCTCASPPSLLEQVLRSGELRVATRNSPAAFFYGAEEPRGIEYELAAGYARRLGVALRIYDAATEDAIFPDVALGRAHIGAAALTVTEGRRQWVEFGPAYRTVKQQVIYRRGTLRPRQAADLIGGRLAVAADSAAVEALELARRDAPELNWSEHRAAGAEDLLELVADGSIDYTVIDSSVFDLLQPMHPEAGVGFALGADSAVAWALPKTSDRSLLESVGEYFAELAGTGALEEIVDRYYHAAGDFDYVGSRTFLRHFASRLPDYRFWFEEAEAATGIDWQLLAAMAYQESHWNPSAVSPTGVRGMMMLTERTAEMMGVEDRGDARESIIGGARYFVRVQRKVPLRIAEPDRLWLAIAAYNVGYGHLEDARILTEMQGGNPDRWDEVRERLPLLREEQWYRRVPRGYARGSEPVLYVDNVRRYYDLLLWMTAEEMVTDDSHRLPGTPPI
jgi:membrane-bound lytic murein transglycosylase F